MFTRLLTFTGAKNIDGGVEYLRDEALPVLQAQHGYRGVSASADRAGAVFSILSLWDTEADRAASESALGKAREEAAKVVGGNVTVERFEQVAQEIVRPPVAGCSLIVTRISMDPASIDENVVFFKQEVAPQIKGEPGFCALRNMIDRESGRGVVGTIWENRDSLDAFAAKATERRASALARGIKFEDTNYREILLSEINK